MEFPLPLKGIDETWGFSKQPAGTTQSARNMRSRDVVSDRVRLSQRSGTRRLIDAYASGVQGDKVQALAGLTTPARTVEYASLGDALGIQWSKATPTSRDCLGVQIDVQGDRYAIDGPTGVVKWNSEGVQQWKIALPAPDKEHIVRALLVDSSDLVFAGISTGGDSKKARLFCYLQRDDKTTELLWELKTNAFVEALASRNGVLHVLLNDPETNRTEIVALDNLFSNLPREIRRWSAPYPGNDLAVSTKDGSVFSAHEPFLRRGFNPKNPTASEISEDWTIKDLPNWRERLWVHLDAKDRESLAIIPVSETVPEEEEGGEIQTWFDLSGHGRNLYAGGGASADTGPTYRKNSAGGVPGVHFNGTSQTLQCDDPPSVDRGDRASSKSIIPTYKGGQFVLFIVMRFPIEEHRRYVLGLNADNSSNRWKALIVNRDAQNSGTLPSSGLPPLPGSVMIHEEGAKASTASASSPAAGLPNGHDNQPLPGGVGPSGLCLVTWICDNNVHDVFGTATRSTLRVNGQPCDRWQSPKGFFSLKGARVGWMDGGLDTGISRFAGEMVEIVVLSDWDNADGVRQRLVEAPAYPDAVWATGSDTELERIEGWLMHRNGMSHELPVGQMSYLSFVTNPVGGDTVTIGGSTYTYTNTPTNPRDVKIGASRRISGTNLFYAINGIGEPDEDYATGTVPHLFVFATACVQNDGPSDTYIMGIRSRNPYSAAIAVSTSGAFASWTAATTTDHIPTGAATNDNEAHFPHPYTLERTSTTTGGPPRATGAASAVSKHWLLHSKWGVLAKWDPANGKPRWVLTSNYDGAGSGVGGVGWGVRIGADGEVYTIGPRQDVATGPPAILADAIDVRKVGDLGDTFFVGTGGTTDPWTAAPGPLEYHYPRMDVDKYGTLFVPIFKTTGGNTISLIAYQKASLGTPTFAGVPIITYDDLTDDNRAHAVAVDRVYPDFPDGFVPVRPERVTLATRLESSPTVRFTVWDLRLLSSTLLPGPQQVHTILVVSQGLIRRADLGLGSFVTVTGGDPGSGGGLDPGAEFVDHCALFNGEMFFLDGITYRVYSKKDDTVRLFTSQSPGSFPLRAKLCTLWNGRLTLARFADRPTGFFMAKKGDPYDANIRPYTVTALQAVKSDASRTADSPDAITALIDYSDDILLVGCENSIQQITGDPMDGGRFDLVCNQGVGFGKAWAQDLVGRLFFFTPRDGIYTMAGIGTKPEPLSGTRLQRRMRDIDLANYRVELRWNEADKALHVFVMPLAAGGVAVEHYVWHETADAWWPDGYQSETSTSLQPTASLILPAQRPSDRRLMIGTESGRVLVWDGTAVGEDEWNGVGAQAVDTSVLIGPLAPDIPFDEVLWTDLDALFADDQDAPFYRVFTSETPDGMRTEVARGRFVPGKNPTETFRARAAFVWLELHLSHPALRWSIERLAIDAQPMGQARRKHSTAP